MSTLLLIPLEDTVVFPNMTVTLAVDDADADALALRIRHAVDAPVLRRYQLVALHHHASVGVLGAGPGGGVDGGCTEVAHGGGL